MTEEGKSMYDDFRPEGKKGAVIARKTVNTMQNHLGGAGMTEEGRDMYDFVRPASKRAAKYARKATNTAVNHGESIVAAMGGRVRRRKRRA
jgi:hypothetical protein